MVIFSFLRNIEEMKKIILDSVANYQSNSTNKLPTLKWWIKKKKFAKPNSLKQSFALFISQTISLYFTLLVSFFFLSFLYLSLSLLLTLHVSLSLCLPSLSHTLCRPLSLSDTLFVSFTFFYLSLCLTLFVSFTLSFFSLSLSLLSHAR